MQSTDSILSSLIHSNTICIESTQESSPKIEIFNAFVTCLITSTCERCARIDHYWPPVIIVKKGNNGHLEASSTEKSYIYFSSFLYLYFTYDCQYKQLGWVDFPRQTISGIANGSLLRAQWSKPANVVTVRFSPFHKTNIVYSKTKLW